MFLKNDTNASTSIRTQLTLFYTSSVLILLLLAGTVLYFGIMHILYQADYEFLSDEVDTVSYVLENKSYDSNILRQVVVDTPTQENRSLYHYYIRIYNPLNKIIIETPGMQNILPQEKSPEKVAISPKKKRYLWYKKNDNQYLLIQSGIPFGRKNQLGHIEILLDVSYQHSMISDKKAILTLIILTTIASLFIGSIISFRGMRQLKGLTDKVKNITVSSLDQRINPKKYPPELHELANAFNMMIDNLEGSVNRLKQFTGDLAHELRSPITNLIGETEMALTYSHTLDDFKLVMSSNLEELHRVSSLIENILFLARADNPKLHVEKEQVDIAVEIKKLIDYFEPMADEKRIVLKSNGAGTCLFNKIMFDRMMSNLISNAIKYTDHNGSVSINIETIDDHLTVTVKDTGIGIPEEHLPNIFNRFYRVDSSRTKSSGGIGLGLAIVKSIVDMHHGKITIESTPNQGTIVILVFDKTDCH